MADGMKFERVEVNGEEKIYVYFLYGDVKIGIASEGLLAKGGAAAPLVRIAGIEIDCEPVPVTGVPIK